MCEFEVAAEYMDTLWHTHKVVNVHFTKIIDVGEGGMLYAVHV